MLAPMRRDAFVATEDPPPATVRAAATGWRARWRRRVRWLARLTALCLLGKSLWVVSCAPDRAQAATAGPLAEVRGRRDALVERLTTDPSPGPVVGLLDPQFQGEWGIVALSMTALATAHLAFAEPSTRTEAIALTAALGREALRPERRAFDTDSWGRDAFADLDDPVDPAAAKHDEGHIGALAHIHLVLGAHRVVGGTGFVEEHRRIQRALLRRLRRAPTPVLATYPADLYAMDNVALQAAVALGALVEPDPDAAAEARRFVAHAQQALLDPATGLMGFAVLNDRPSPSRGSGVGWNSIYLPLVDAAFAAEQWQRTRAVFGVALPWGMFALREYPRGVEGSGDVDSGPALFGLSPAGTGFGLAGARHAGDVDAVLGMLRIAEVAGFTVPWRGGRAYLLAPLVGDAAVLAARTATPMDRRFLSP